MNYPLISEYISAILSAEDNLYKFNSLRPVFNDKGEVIMSSGNFAVVFKMRDKDTGAFYAVKCFLRDQIGRAESYRLITSKLDSIDCSYIISFGYYENELYVDTIQTKVREFPILIMDWVEGVTLDKYMHNHIIDKYKLQLITFQFCKLAAWLLSQDFAHGDLKPDNILVKPDGQLVLIDYDGMYVPSMKGQKAREIGSPDYRHPLRTENTFNSHIDDFSLASIALSLKCISVKPDLLHLYGLEERLLFSSKDYLDLDKSQVLQTIKNLPFDTELNRLLGLFYIAFDHGNLMDVSSRLFNITVPSKANYELWNTEVTEEDLSDAIEDENGVKYSKDGIRLLSGYLEGMKTYSIRPDTQIIANDAFALYYGFGCCSPSLDFCSPTLTINFPNSVRCIGDYAFYNCSNIQSIRLPQQMTSIGNCSFMGCNDLSFIYLPSSLINIGDGCFAECFRLKRIECASPFLHFDGNIIIFNDKLIACVNKEITSIKIPNYVTRICDHAFSECIYLASINIPSSVTEIGSYAFFNCKNLKSIDIPIAISEIGEYAFAHCTNLSFIVIPESIKTINNNTFENCANISFVSLPSCLQRIGKYVFRGCKSLNSVVIPDTVEYIGDRIFENCEALSSVELPQFIKEMGCNIFMSCFKLRQIACTSPKFEFDRGLVIFDKKLVSCVNKSDINIIIPKHVTSIGDYAFDGCTNLTSIILPYGITFIGYSSFTNCTNLEIIRFPISLHNVNERIFEGCRNIKSIQIPLGSLEAFKTLFDDASKREEIVSQCPILRYEFNSAFIDKLIEKDFVEVDKYEVEYNSNFTKLLSIPKSLTTYKVKEGTKCIGEKAAIECKKLEEIILPSSLIEIERGAFKGCKSLSTINLPNGVLAIGVGAFSLCTSLSMINIPDSTLNIGDGAFYHTKGLKKIYSKDMSSDGNCLINNGHLIICITHSTHLVIPSEVSVIGSGAFQQCSNLQTIEIPDSVKEIKYAAFANCRNLIKIELPKTIKKIPQNAFSNCYNLKSVLIPESVTSIEHCAFSGCVCLEKVHIPQNVTTVGDGIFSGCFRLQHISSSLISSDGIFLINQGQLKCCLSNESKIIIPNGITKICKEAFSNNNLIESIVIPETVCFIGKSAFAGCHNLKHINIPSSVKQIESGAFCGCESLENINCQMISKDGNYLVSQGRLIRCSSKVRHIIVPKEIDTIGKGAFNNCKDLEFLEIPDSVMTIEGEVFRDCKNLKKIKSKDISADGKFLIHRENLILCLSTDANITVPENVKTIESGAFSNCCNMQSISIPDNVIRIKDRAFDGCFKLSNISSKHLSEDGNYLIDNGKLLFNLNGSAHIIIPDKVYVLSCGLFFNSLILQTIILPESVKIISKQTFYGCANLHSIILPSSIAMIGRWAFDNCTSLTSIFIPKNTKQYYLNVFNQFGNERFISLLVEY